MNEPTITPTATLPEIKNENPRIAVAVFWWPNTFNDVAHTILQNAILAGLQQRSIEPQSRNGYFRKFFSVQVLEVAAGLQERSIIALQETLAALSLKDRSILAKLTDGEWVTIGGSSDGAIEFEAAFLNPKEIDLAEKEGLERIERNTHTIEWVKQNLAEILKNPDFGK